MIEELGTGYDVDAENLASIEAGQRKRRTEELFAASYDGPINEAVRQECKALVPIEMQARTSSCVGHGGSSTEEFNQWLEEKRWVQRSRWGTYILAQEADNRPAVDNGATLDGLARMGKSIGFGREQLWKFTGTYHRNPPGGRGPYLADAKNRTTKSYKRLLSYADMALWSQTGQGGIVVGWPWFENWSVAMPKTGIVPQPSGRLVGYHCVALFWQTKRTEGSRYFFEGPNSYSKNWGAQGWAEWSPSLIDWLMRYRGSVVIGFSGMRDEEAVARPLNYLTSSSFIK